MNNLSTLDISVIIFYFVLISTYGYWIYRRKKNKEVSGSHDFFLAEGSLTWWAIGASLIASNISSEQFVAMSGDGFKVGIAVAAYEWVAAIALIIVAVWFIPIYLKNKIFTMPQFLQNRYNTTVSLIMSIFWLVLYIFVNLTSILYLGTVAISSMINPEYATAVMWGLAIFALFITLGGMKVIGFTDVIQVVVLIIGGLATTYIALTLVSEKFGLGKDAIAGFKVMMQDAPDHFQMILKKPDASSSQEYINKYLALPGIAMYFAGQWIVNLNYWGCNQYITQRALGADLQTARKGILFAGFLKLGMPIIVMLPGIAAYVLHKNGDLTAQMAAGGHFKSDNAYSAILGFLPEGLKGLSVAALTAAIVASLAGKANSISTIFTLDIYKKYLKKDADDKNLVLVGKLTIGFALLLSIYLTVGDKMSISGEGGFTFIQKYTGYFSPGVFAMFLLGMFWKRTTGLAGIIGLLSGFLLSVLFNNFAPALFGNETWLYTAFPNGKGQGVYEIPFLICMGWAFAFTMLIMIVTSLAGPKVNPKAFIVDKEMFKLSPAIIAMIAATVMILAALYIKFW